MNLDLILRLPLIARFFLKLVDPPWPPLLELVEHKSENPLRLQARQGFLEMEQHRHSIEQLRGKLRLADVLLGREI